MKVLQIGKTTYKVSDFLSWQRAGSLVLSPSFQRRAVWPPAAKSYLIDSVVRGLAMPIVFLRERTDLETLEPKREIVDGQQRLRTLFSFIDPPVLPDYDEKRDSFVVRKAHNAEIAGKTFRQLPRAVQQQLLTYEFSVHILPSDTEDRDVLQIFARLNSTGVKVNPQEVRNALFTGEFKGTMYELAHEQLDRWRRWAVFDERDIARMKEVEATSEFVLLIMKGLQGKTQRALDRMYRENEESFPGRPEVTRRFQSVMDQIDDTVGDELRSLVFSRQALFYTLFGYCYDLMFGLDSPLEPTAAKRIPTDLVGGLRQASNIIRHRDFGEDEDLRKALRGATSDIGTRTTRLNFLRRVCERGEA